MEEREYYDNGKINYEIHYDTNGEKHKTDGPAVRFYDEDGKIEREAYFINGKKHREDGPAEIDYYLDGKIQTMEYWLNGIRYEDIFKWMVMVGSI